MSKNLLKQSIFALLDQLFSYILIIAINFYLARKLYINEIGIFALIFASFGFAQVIQQAILERPFLIRKNIFNIKIIIKRFAVIIIILFLSVLYFYFTDTNTLPDVSLNPLFIIPWLVLGVVQLLFNLVRVYFYTINNEKLAFLMSFFSTSFVFLVFIIGQNYIEKRITIFMFLISIVKLITILFFTSYFTKLENTNLTEDSSNLQYINLILISLSVFLKGRFLVFYLANFAFTLAGLYEILRNILEIVLMPFRPISQTLLNKFSSERGNKISIPLVFFTVFGLGALAISTSFYFALEILYSLYNISYLSTESLNLYLAVFVFVSILIIPINASLLAYKHFLDELLVKILPTLYIIFNVLLSSEIQNMEYFMRIISTSAIIEALLAILFLTFRKYFSRDKIKKVNNF